MPRLQTRMTVAEQQVADLQCPKQAQAEVDATMPDSCMDICEGELTPAEFDNGDGIGNDDVTFSCPRLSSGISPSDNASNCVLDPRFVCDVCVV